MKLKSFLTCLGFVTAAFPAWGSQIHVEAGNTSGFSYFADPAAQSIPGISANPSLQLAVANGDDLFLGTVVLIGSFLGFSDSAIKAHENDISFFQENFTQYGALHIGDNDSPAGSLSGSVTANSGALAGEQIYLLLVAGTDSSSPSSSFSTAFQIGVYYFDKSINPAWAFPSDNPVTGVTAIDISDLTLGNEGTALNPTGAHVVIGGFGPDHSNTFPTKTNFTLAAVPEPGSALLLGSIGLGTLALRRRKASR